jgi:hypothetical protein
MPGRRQIGEGNGEPAFADALRIDHAVNAGEDGEAEEDAGKQLPVRSVINAGEAQRKATKPAEAGGPEDEVQLPRQTTAIL